MLTDTGNYSLSLKYVQRSLSIATAIHSKPLLIDCYTETGRIYDFQSDFIQSSDFFFKALTLAQEINDHEKIAMIGTNLTAAFFNQGDYKKTLEYSSLTLKEANIAHAPIHAYKALYMTGMVKAVYGDSAAARDYFYKAIEICRKNSFALNEAEVNTDLATVVTTNEERIELLMKSRKIYDSLSPASFNSTVNLENLGEAFIAMYKAHPDKREFLNKAETYIDLFEKRSEEKNDRASMAQAFDNLSAINQLKGDYRKAYQFVVRYHAINDSIFSQDNKNKIASLESGREMEKKNKEIAIQKLQVREQQKNAFIFLAGLILMAALGLMFYRLSAVRKQKNKELTQLNKELDEANKVKSKFFGILSHDLRSPVANLVNFLNLRKMKPEAFSKEQSEEREHKISTSAQVLLETMESMLLWSKSQMEQFRPEKKSVPADALFSYIQKNFAGNENIVFKFTNEYNIQLQTDENYLNTIMYNLTANSVKALYNISHAVIEWKAWKENEKMFLSITDNGPGIDSGKVKSLYDDSIGSNGKNGLGFYIIRDLAKAVGCSIAMQKNSNRGALFLLSF